MRSTELGRLAYFKHHLIICGLGSAIVYFIFLAAQSSGFATTSLVESFDYIIEIALLLLLALVLQMYSLVTVFFRLNDLGKSWWQALLIFVPFVNLYIAAVLFFVPGRAAKTAKENPAELDDDLGVIDQDDHSFPLTTCAIMGLAALLIFPTLAVRSVLSTLESTTVSSQPTFLQANPVAAQRPAPTPVRAPNKQRPVLCDEGRNKEELDQYLRAGNPEAALSRFQAMEAKCGIGISLRWSAFAAYKRLGNFKSAFRTIDSLIAHNPEDRDYWAWRGQLHEQLGNWREAAADYEQTLTLAPKLKSIPLNLTGVYEQLNSPCQAATTLKRYMEHYPNLNQANEIVAKLSRLEGACQAQQDSRSAQAHDSTVRDI